MPSRAGIDIYGTITMQLPEGLHHMIEVRVESDPYFLKVKVDIMSKRNLRVVKTILDHALRMPETAIAEICLLA